jgi:hypothetical protein
MKHNPGEVMPKNDWNEYKRLILSKMDEDEKRWTKMFEIVSGIKSDVSGLKAKAAIAGGIAGVVGTAVVTAVVELWK